MKHYYCILFFLLISSISVFGDTIPLEGTWSEKDLRSAGLIPFTVEKESNVLFIYSEEAVTDIQIGVISENGDILYDALHSFSTSETVIIFLGNLPKGRCFVSLSGKNGGGIGEFVNI